MRVSEEMSFNLHAKPSASSDVLLESEFLSWAKSRKDLFETPVIRNLVVNEQTIFRTTVKVTGKGLEFNKQIYGTGRGDLPSQSLIKAYAEAIERIAMLNFETFADYSQFKLVENSKDKFKFKKILRETDYTVFPRAIKSSNGWAAHFKSNESAINGFKEALERHILFYSFFKEGWEGLIWTRDESFEGFRQEYFVSKFSIFSTRAGLVRSKSKVHPGYTYGYNVFSDSNYTEKINWLHAVLESGEPLLSFDKHDREYLEGIKATSSDYLEIMQLDHLLSNLSAKNFGSHTTHRAEQSVPDQILINQVNCRNFLGMPFDFYVSFVFSPSFFTFYKPGLTNKQGQLWIEKTFELNGFSMQSEASHVPLY